MRIDIVRDDLESEEERELEVDEGLNVEDLLDELEVESEEVLVARNGSIISSNHQLEEGDEIRVMDVIAGG
ncbi:MAG: MoaD/ThiS family protein [Candidatus Nanohaloarchaea archaeon]